MFRVLRAFAWMRWRVLVNSLERTGTRDTAHRLAVAIDTLLPFLVPLILIPSALAIGALAMFAGLRAAAGEFVLLDGARYVMLAATIAAVIGPILLPAANRTNPVRLLLLPIEARTLYVAQSAGTLTDPWVFLMIPVVLALPVGLAIGGQATGAGTALLAGLAFIAILMGLSALTTTAVHLLLRDRRRGELVTLALILLLPFLGLLPAAFGDAAERRARRNRAPIEQPGEAPAPRPDRRLPVPPWVRDAGSRAFAAAPSQLYASAVGSAARGAPPASLRAISTLGALLVTVHALGLLLFQRVLASPGSTSQRRAATSTGGLRVLPAISPAASAVALALLKLVLRTPRGRSTLLAPLILFVFFSIMPMLTGRAESGPFAAAGGIVRAAFMSLLALVTPLPITMNHFAIDRAGLTMTLLAPIAARQIVIGKLVGCAIIAILPSLAAVALSAVFFFGGHPALWLALVIAVPATYLVAAPATTALSAVFPRVVDMNSIGSRSNAHAAASLLGMLLMAVAALPSIGLTFVAAQLLGQPWLAPLFVSLWAVAAGLLARLLLAPAVKTFENRRESLATLV